MQKRILSLDGIRGLAVLSVLLNHINATGRVTSHFNSPFLVNIYNTISAGASAVQILFVLSGFLIAFLYPTIESKLSFIQKRYARIIPIYLVIVTSIWIFNLNQIKDSPFLQIIILLTITFFAHSVWRKLKYTSKKLKLGLFLSFISLQIIALIYGTYTTLSSSLVIKDATSSFLTYITNISLTFPFNIKVNAIEGILWSLVLEMLFYILYPLIIIHLVKLGKKNGFITSFLIISISTIVLFALDSVFPTIARSSSFIAGIVAGTLYQSNSKKWKMLKQVLKKPLVGIAILILFVLVQWGDLNVVALSLASFSNQYYFISSWVFALLILASIIPNTIPNKILSNKYIVFCGMISYSLYLIHSQIIRWNNILFYYLLNHLFTPILYVLIYFSILISTIIVSYILYKLIEHLYFEREKKQL